jgi:hypothetical protein
MSIGLSALHLLPVESHPHTLTSIGRELGVSAAEAGGSRGPAGSRPPDYARSASQRPASVARSSSAFQRRP